MFEAQSSLFRRSSSRVTVVVCHLPPRAAGISRAFNSCAMAFLADRPAFRSLRIVGSKAWLVRPRPSCFPVSSERDQAQSLQEYPSYSHVVPASATGGRYTPPV